MKEKLQNILAIVGFILAFIAQRGRSDLLARVLVALIGAGVGYFIIPAIIRFLNIILSMLISVKAIFALIFAYFFNMVDGSFSQFVVMFFAGLFFINLMHFLISLVIPGMSFLHKSMDVDIERMASSVGNAFMKLGESSGSDERRRAASAKANKDAYNRWYARDQQKKAEWDARDAYLRGKDPSRAANGARNWKNEADKY